jgi:heparosan-N-sulfate-glucuronate 5-epimerase
VTQKGEYHALTISFYGIMNYEDFIITGDSACYQRVINQFRYFQDSSRVIYIDSAKGMGLPYHKQAYDLKPIWYCGMTQGVALSFLARYYLLTRNEDALHKMKQVAYFMLRPQEKGGTLGRTPEGYLWIEEYP